MADERAMLARARDYLRELSEGKDPLTGRATEDDVLSQPRLRRCFAFVAAYLQRELARSAEVGETFAPTEEQKLQICLDEDIPAAEFYAKMRAGSVAKTAAVNSESFISIFEGSLSRCHIHTSGNRLHSRNGKRSPR